ncbi:hypothetical protein [Bowmanella pacifica]|uniref:Uncharacterized protein n=1 Tax=Bowmanella pacifica TaxID=502051 RepID=A0A917YR83_9ALTE|nr:hypothetical protein [Bowmanella pacifica]GGO64434.1 hypothetical protein GCM10010982_03830 [Bowmanella pacifica]
MLKAYFAIVSFLSVLSVGPALAAPPGNWQAKLAGQMRVDERSGKDLRYQYRLRFYPAYHFDAAWSLQAFVATGKGFASSHNTLDDGKADHLYLRRLYLRHQDSAGKTEFGVIPTYKGDVASTGLSKDGWINGLRRVQNMNANTRLEVVVGELAHLDNADAWQKWHSLNYAELELSSRVNNALSYELSLEHMLGDNFLRGELRYQSASQQTYAIELVDRLDSNKVKLVLSFGMPLAWLGKNTELFSHYSYADKGFGERAELTEDFLDYGHAIALELDGKLGVKPWGWFAKFEHYAEHSTNRAQLGIKFSF